MNYLARLGWSHGDQEIFSAEDLIRDFDLAHVGKAGAVFDPAKLEWLSHHWLKAAPSLRLAADLAPFLEREGLPVPDDRAWLARVVDTLKERAPTLVEMARQATFYLRAPAAYDHEATAKFWKPGAAERYALLIRRLEAHEEFEPASLELLYRGLAAELGLKLVDLAQLTRIALTGRTASPPIFEVVEHPRQDGDAGAYPGGGRRLYGRRPVKTLYLARHGQSVSNAVRRFQGHQDVPLSELGRRQASALSAGLRGRPVAHVYASPLDRARSTAELVVAEHGVPLTLVEDLRELSLGDWEGRTVEEIQALPGDPYACWVRDPVGGCPPNGEPLERVQARVVRAIEAIVAAHPNGDDVLVVCHGGVISAYLAHCFGLPLSSIWRVSVSNCSLSAVAPPRVLSVNDVSHLAGIEVGSGAPSLAP